MSTVDYPVMLIVLDGWGHSDDTQYNAIHSANKPTWDRLQGNYPHTLIRCSGQDVGLPDDQMGNSEVGHMHLGAGRKINQDYSRISLAIEDGDFFCNPVLRPALERAAANGKAFHLLGLLSQGGVHSHEEHIVALIELAARAGVKRVYVHAFLDGRDTPPKSAAESIQFVQRRCDELGVGHIATLVGRYYAMDRNKHWEHTRAAYELIVDGRALYECSDPLLALDHAYRRGETDEFVKTTAIMSDESQRVRVADGDAIAFANFRADRARQLTAAFTSPAFTEFDRTRLAKIDTFITMTSYGAQFDLPTAFSPTALPNTYGEWIDALGLRQLRIAETEKYAHVTFFFNGGIEAAAAGEERILVPSPEVATYDLKPEMSAVQVTDALVEAISSRTFDTVICNYANPDMVGHTGDFEATVKCIETVDKCLERVVAAARKTGMEVLITADHGNAEKMRSVATKQKPGQAHTAHTNNLVPLVYIGREAEVAPNGCLSDIAPTMLSLMALEIPPEMTGRPLIILKDKEQCAA